MRLVAGTILAMLATASLCAGAEGLSPKEIQSAQKLNVVKCSKCHELYKPGAYSQEEWDRWMQKMTKKAKLKPDQAELLSRYFKTMGVR